MKNQRDITIYNNKGEIKAVDRMNLENQSDNPDSHKKSPLKWIIIVGISVLLISGNTLDNPEDNDIIVNNGEKSKKLENESQFNTKVNDLKRINVR